MSRMSHRLIFAAALAAVTLWTAQSFGEITLITPQVQVYEGDRTVTLIWNDPIPENLVSIEEPVLGSVQFPWDGHAVIEAGGFYTGACDWTYDVMISRFAGADTVMELNWQEVTDWMTQRVEARRIQVTEMDQVIQLSDGIEITIKSDGLFDLDMVGWTGPIPDLSGLLIDAYATLDTADYAKPIDFVFTCTSGGDLTGASGEIGFGWEARIAWPDITLAPDSTLLGSGSFVIETADSPKEFFGGLRMGFPAGAFVEGEYFSADVLMPLVAGDRLGIIANTFEGYLVLRHSVEDRPAVGSDSIGLYKVMAAISKCDSFELFVDSLTSLPDPYGERRYIDRGVMVDQPGVDPDPDLKTVLNGFPYDYAVVTYDWSRPVRAAGAVDCEHRSRAQSLRGACRLGDWWRGKDSIRQHTTGGQDQDIRCSRRIHKHNPSEHL
jgi:hypothetical protein